jgi:protein-tyrosine phosphatase
MIDLHNHILWGLDDGALDLEESLEIARQFVSEGVDQVAATPHFNPEHDAGLDGVVVRTRVGELQEALHAHKISLAVVPGNELYLTPDSPALVIDGTVCRLGDGGTVLVELSLLMGQRPLYLDDTIFRLQVAGFQVVLAHPERYAFMQSDVQSLDAIVERGLLLQVTAPALLDEYGPAVRKTAERLLARGAYRLASSDRHHPGPNRSLAALSERIEQLANRQTAELLLQDNPARILAGDETIASQPVQPTQRTFFDRILRRDGY